MSQCQFEFAPRTLDVCLGLHSTRMRGSTRGSETMRYLTFSLPGDRTERLGAVRGDRAVEVAKAIGSQWTGPAPTTLVGLIEAGPDTWRRVAGLLESRTPAMDADHPRLTDIVYCAPIPRPR